MTHFIKNGNTTRITDQASFDIRDHLPAGTYTVKQDPRSDEFYLENDSKINENIVVIHVMPEVN